MARITLGICLMLVVASSVIYEAQGFFLLKNYLKSKFPSKSDEFTPYANQGLMMFATNLESGCPPTTEFKNFFSQFKSYMSFVSTASATSSKNIDMELSTKCDGLFKAMAALSGGSAQKSTEAGSFKSTMISMGKTLIEQKKNAVVMSLAQKKSLIMAMVKWTKMIATSVKTAAEKKGKTIDLTAYGLDVNVNDKSIISSIETRESSSSSHKSESSKSHSSSSSTQTEKASSMGKAASGGSTEKGAAAGKTKEESSTKAGASGSTKGGSTYKDTTGGSGSPTGSPTGSPSNMKTQSSTGSAAKKEQSAAGSAANKKEQSTAGSAANKKEQSAAGSAASKNSQSTAAKNTQSTASKNTQSSQSTQSSSSVKQVEKETSKEVMSFLSGLEKKYSAKPELKPFFQNVKTSMTASTSISSKSSQEYSSTARSATGKLNDAMSYVGSGFQKSGKMKSNMETSKDQMLKTLKEIQDINSQIVNTKSVTSTQQSELKQTLSKFEQVTTQFVETAASSSSSSSSSSQKSQSQSQQQSSAASQKEGKMGMVKEN